MNRYATEWSDPPPDEVELVVIRDGVADPVCWLARGDADPEWWALIIEALSDSFNDSYKFWRPALSDDDPTAGLPTRDARWA